MILRPAKKEDCDAILALIQHAHLGLTSLPRDREHLLPNIKRSLYSFSSPVTQPQDEYYLFVLEDTVEKKIIGISAMFATAGGKEPLYFFKKERDHTIVPQELLSPVSYVRGPSELCSLFLHPEVRKKGVGKLLSFGRLLFVAKYPERFTTSFFAELRGVIINDESPFWNGLGSHFYHASFSETQKKLLDGRRFIADFLPKYPIYATLLSKEAQEVIGKTHPNTAAALTMLLKQGFEISDEIDVFDGGPKLKGQKMKLHAVATSFTLPIGSIEEQLSDDSLYFFSNEKLQNFRATLGPGCIQDGTLHILRETAEALQLTLHDTIRIYEAPK